MNLLDKVISLFCGRKRHRNDHTEDEIQEYNNIMSLKKRTLDRRDNNDYIFKKLIQNANYKVKQNKIIYNQMGVITSLCRGKRQHIPIINEMVIPDNIEYDEEIVEIKKSIFHDYEFLVKFIEGKEKYYKLTPEQFIKIQR
jgi:hypothetical protein